MNNEKTSPTNQVVRKRTASRFRKRNVPWYYATLTMNRVQKTINPKLNLAVWFCLVASLLFSVGEGLRLTPFPVGSIELLAQPGISAAQNVTTVGHGPIDVPVQIRKGSKRNSTDIEIPSVSNIGEVTLCASATHDSSTVSFLTVPRSRSFGRAPPGFLI